MLGFFSKKKVEVLVLYKFENIETISEKEFDEVISFLSKIMNINNSYLSYLDIKFKDYNFEIFPVKEKKIKKKFNTLMSFMISDVNPVKKKPNIQFSFRRSCNPSRFVLEFSNGLVQRDDICKLVTLINPIYGFIYEITQSDYNTEFVYEGYSKGMPKIKGLEKFEEPKGYFSKNITRLKDGFLREIFDVNFLTDKQLTKTTNGRTLQDFIKNEGIGSLKSINSNNYIWEISEADKSKAEILPREFYL
jgi:hypothetical protein